MLEAEQSNQFTYQRSVTSGQEPSEEKEDDEENYDDADDDDKNKNSEENSIANLAKKFKKQSLVNRHKNKRHQHPKRTQTSAKTILI